jgi:hypothetical protein
MTCLVSSRPRYGLREHLKFFFGVSMICNAKSVFLAVHTSLCCLNNVSGVYLVQVSLILIGQHPSSVNFCQNF